MLTATPWTRCFINYFTQSVSKHVCYAHMEWRDPTPFGPYFIVLSNEWSIYSFVGRLKARQSQLSGRLVFDNFALVEFKELITHMEED